MRLRSGAAVALVLLACCGAQAEPAAREPSAPKSSGAPAATRVCDLVHEDEVRSIYSGVQVQFTEYAGPVGEPSFDSCQVTIDYGSTTRPARPFPLQVSIDEVPRRTHEEMLRKYAADGLGPRTEIAGLGDEAYFVAPGYLHVYADRRVVRVESGGRQNAIELANLVLRRLDEFAPAAGPGAQPACDAVTAQAEAVLGAPVALRSDRMTEDELRCSWSAGATTLSATLRGFGDELGRVWAMELPGAEVIHIGGVRDNGVYMATGGIYFWMGRQQVSMYLRHRPHDTDDDRDRLIAFADAFAPLLLEVAPRVGKPLG